MSDVERAALLHLDGLEVFTIIKCVFAYFPERTREHNLLDPAVFKTFSTDILDPVWNLNFLKILAIPERLRLDSLQDRRKPDALDRASMENLSLVFGSGDDLLRA